MKILDIMAAPWYLTPDHLAELKKAYDKYLESPQAALDAFDKNMASFIADVPERGFEIVNNKAIIPITGILTPELGLFSFIFGGTSTEAVQLAVMEAVADSAIEEIILLIDTPGGVVYNTQETAQTIFNARGSKPITSFVKGKMLSAGTYIASAADKVFASGDLVDIGHIGVRTTHTDISQLEQSLGVKVTDLSVGAFKTLGTPHKPLSREDEDQIMEGLKYAYGIFTGDVAKYRGLEQQAIMDMGARVFQGKQAIDVGLADGLTTFDDIINQPAGNNPARRAQGGKKTREDRHMDVTKLKTEHPDTYAAIIKIGKEEGITAGQQAAQKDIEVKLAAARTDGITEGAANETKRIADVQAQMPKTMKNDKGCEKLIAKLIADGKTTGPGAAVKVLAYQEAQTAAAGEAFEFDGDQVEASAATDKDDLPEGGKDFMSLVKEYKADKECSQGEAIKAVSETDPEAHAKYIQKLKG